MQTKQKFLERDCKHHGFVQFVLEGSGYYRCLTCRKSKVHRKRGENKALIREECGNKCGMCGYDKCKRNLAFHHINPKLKSFSLCAGGIYRTMESLRAEAKKCVLLCANCHGEVEEGISEVPLELLEGKIY